HDTLPKIVSKPQGAMLPDEPKESDDKPDNEKKPDEEEFVDPLAVSDHRNERILSHSPAPPSQDSENEQSQTVNKDSVDKQDASNQQQPQKEEPQSPTQTLSDIEQAVGAHHQQSEASNNQTEEPGKPDMNFAPAHSATPSPSHRSSESPAELDEARQAIMDATATPNTSADQPLPPVESLNAQPVHLNIHPDDTQDSSSSNQKVQNPNQPPPVPPPMMPPN
ncbi:MAG: hypothetical protein LC687_03560, partial [Actinobacteria bacterium]|nr:hypothetical protein [Actinomycetota bacterium]